VLDRLLQFAEEFSLEDCRPGKGGAFTEAQADRFRRQAEGLQGLLDDVRGRVLYCDEGSGEAQLMREVLQHVQGHLAPLLNQVAEAKGPEGEAQASADARAQIQQQGQGLVEAVNKCADFVNVFISHEEAAKARAEKAVGLLNRAQYSLEYGKAEGKEKRLIEDIKQAINADSALAPVLQQLDSTLEPSVLGRLKALNEDFKNFMQKQLANHEAFAAEMRRKNKDRAGLEELGRTGHAFQ
jgi:hypothetical protein